MKLISSTPNGEAWRRYAARAAKYAAQLRALGLAHDGAERQRAREAICKGILRAQHEARKCRSALRIIKAVSLTKYKKALAAA